MAVESLGIGVVMLKQIESIETRLEHITANVWWQDLGESNNGKVFYWLTGYLEESEKDGMGWVEAYKITITKPYKMPVPTVTLLHPGSYFKCHYCDIKWKVCK